MPILMAGTSGGTANYSRKRGGSQRYTTMALYHLIPPRVIPSCVVLCNTLSRCDTKSRSVATRSLSIIVQDAGRGGPTGSGIGAK